jgi:predicted RNA polymerase sigma factor
MSSTRWPRAGVRASAHGDSWTRGHGLRPKGHRLGRTAEARSSYEKALALTQQEPERQFLQERIRQLK